MKRAKGVPGGRRSGTSAIATGSTVPIDGSRKGIQSVELAFAILEVMHRAPGPMAIKEIAGALDLSLSKIHHYLVSLTRVGVVTQRQTSGRYALGPFALQLGLAAITLLDPSEFAFDAARTFRDDTGESTFVSVFGNRGPTIIRYMEGSRPLIVNVKAGLVLPLLTSATGHVFLSWLPEAAWSSVARLERSSLVGARRISETPDVAATISQTRSLGLGVVTTGALIPRVSALSVPIFDKDGSLVLALSALGWTEEFDGDVTGALAERLKRVADDVSGALGYRAQPAQIAARDQHQARLPASPGKA
jgi:DNA-binding IclR family transcriptional regulator